jgi:hypothetical protein
LTLGHHRPIMHGTDSPVIHRGILPTEAGKRKAICAIEEYCRFSNTQSRPGVPINGSAPHASLRGKPLPTMERRGQGHEISHIHTQRQHIAITAQGGNNEAMARQRRLEP